MNGKEVEAFGKRKITCPYCAYEYSDSWEKGMDNDGDSQEEECPECDKKFHVCINVNVDYTSTGLCAENNEEHDWEYFDFISDDEDKRRVKGRKCLTCGEYEHDKLEKEAKA